MKLGKGINDMSQEKTKTVINWQPLIEIGIGVAVIFGTTVPLYLHTDNKLHEAIKEMRAEMKDFHGRLCILEERNKSS